MLAINTCDFTTGRFFCTIVNDTDRSQLTAAIDILLHRGARDVDEGVATHGTCPLHRRIDVCHIITFPVDEDGCRVGIIVTA